MADPAGAPPESTNSSRKVVSITSGEAHTLALTGDGCVYSWGRGTFGRLGTGSEADEIFPVRIHSRSEEERIKFVGIAAGAYHSLAVADDGSVWCWGYNAFGQLGVDGESSSVPHLLERFLELGSSETKNKTPLKVSFVKGGGMMSAAIDNLGGLWLWGNCPQHSSENGEFSLFSTSIPKSVSDFHGHTVVKVACGNEHVIAFVTAGETYKGGDILCYSWGGNNHGQLGLGDRESRSKPQIIRMFDDESSWELYEVACGAFHTALLAKQNRKPDLLESSCWTFGLGDNGQLGHGTTKAALAPECVKGLPRNVFLVSVDCGLFHTSAVSSNGDVWSWGMEKGLGLCPDANLTLIDAGDAISPVIVSRNGIGLYGPKFIDPVQIVCGAAHTILVAEDGYKLWAWGRGINGVLGTGGMVDCFSPAVVLWPPQVKDEKLEQVTETDKILACALEDMKILESKYSIMEQYASILHGSVFGKPFGEEDIPISLRKSGVFNLGKEWENMLESADDATLFHLEAFYRSMLGGVKDKRMKRRIEEIVKDCMNSSTSRN